jgi:uncharacterized protein YkwD
MSLSIGLQAQDFKGAPTGEERIASSNEKFETEVLVLVNKIRKRRGLSQLKSHKALTNAARYHAMDMGTESYFDHNSMDVDKNGRKRQVAETFERIRKFTDGTNVFGCGENISAGQPTPKDVVDTWMKSKGHRKNIIKKNISYMGVGYAKVANSDYGHYWVQVFGQ